MSDLSLKRMLEAYKEMAGAPTFLSTFFQTGPRDIHNANTVEFDVRRDGRPIAVAVTSYKAGGQINQIEKFTNKSFEPPILYEEFALNSLELMQRQMGQDPFQDVNFMSAAQMRLSEGVEKMLMKIRRTVELQAAQVLQTGVVTLTDSAGNTVYTVDFGMRASHQIDAGVDWDETTSDPISDLEAMDEQVRLNGKKRISDFILGDSARSSFLSNSKVQALLENRRIVIGGIAPTMPSEDQIFIGTININGHIANLWGYQASYDSPNGGTDTKYVSDWNVIGLSRDAVRRATFGGIPRIVAPDPRVAPLGIGSLVAADRGIAVTTNAWVDPRGENVFGSVATRPLMIPVAIDAHAVLNAKVT